MEKAGILIVDDDFLFRYAIREQLDWEAEGYEIIGEARNGAEALQLMRDRTPDIVITDISMPGMDGMELIRRIRKDYPLVGILVMSCYDDFQFAKESLKLGAKDYILKQDMESTDLKQQLRAIICERDEKLEAARLEAKIESYRVDALEQNWRKLLLHESIEEEALKRYSERLDIGDPGGIYYIAYLLLEDGSFDDDVLDKISDSYQALRGIRTQAQSHCVYMMNADFCCVMRFQADASGVRAQRQLALQFVQTAKMRLTELFGGAVTVGMAGPTESIRELSTLYHSAQTAVNDRIYDGKGKLFWAKDERELKQAAPIGNIDARELLEHMRRGDREGVDAALGAIRGALSAAKPERAELNSRLMELLYEILSAGAVPGVSREKQVALNSHYVRTVTEKLSMDQQFDAILEYCEKIMNLRLQNVIIADTPINKIIVQVVEYINAHYAEEITADLLSERFAVSPNYLGSMFRKATGCKLTEYINHVRIEHAKRLLNESNLKVNEIAERTGFSSMTYFCTIFQRVTGQTASQYKQQCEKNADGKPRV